MKHMEGVDLEIRMIERVPQRIVKFYQISLAFIILTTLSLIFYFWKIGFIDGSRSKDLHKANYLLEAYETKPYFDQIKSFIWEENPKLAIEKIREIESEIEEIDKLVEVESFKNLKKELQNLKNASAELISYSKITKVQSVFNTKMMKFYEYVKLNNWRTLTRMSDRIFTITNGHINREKIGSMTNNVNRDFNSMIKITENSVLSRKDKSEIISRIKNLQVEIDMLAKYGAERGNFFKVHEKAAKELKGWLAAVAPELTYQKLKIEQMGVYYVIGLLGVAGLVTTVFLFSFVYNRFMFVRFQNDLEKKLEQTISEQLIEGVVPEQAMFSSEFENYLSRMSGYINKRMSFGSIFQDALPLASILLDQNLKLIWANKQFCSDWMISTDEVNKDYMSWDFLNKLTNIGHEDPVIEALKHGVAGIYQVQVKPNDEEASRPYEMFVSPVKHNGQTRIMLFFYDLTNIEETIKDQAKGLLNPIKESLTLLSQNESIDSEQLAYGFQIAGISDVYQNFMTLENRIETDKANLVDEIEILHSWIDRYQEFKEDVANFVSMNASFNRDKINSLKVFKESVIGLSELSKNLNKVYQDGTEIICANKVTLNSSMQKIATLGEGTSEILKSLHKFDKTKEELREFKSQLYEAKSKLAYELSQLSLFMKRAHEAGSMEKLGRTLTKVKATFDEMNTHADNLDKKVSSVEIIVSKAQLVIGNVEEKLSTMSINPERQQVSLIDSYLGQTKSFRAGVHSEVNQLEEDIIGGLKGLFNATKSSTEQTVSLDSSMKQRFVASEESSQA